jgi:hypothetical protein
MRRLSSLILGLVFSISLFSQTSPHGDGFAISCTDCHNTEGWKIDFKTLSFDHGTTKFALTGQHQAVPCRACHQSLQFSRAGKECVACHTDMHNQTVGTDCSRCHTTTAWIVNNITEIHQRSRFPLVGAHITADCYDCHLNASASLLNFGPLGVECIDCHQKDYDATTKPNHVSAQFPTTCNDCHSINAFSWTGAGFNHANITSGCEECHMTDYNATTDPNHSQSGFSTVCLDCHKLDFTSWNNIDHSFFPLTAGHATNECTKCHPSGSNYANTSPICASCHQPDYNGTTNPSHTTLNFSTICQDCHTTNPGWKPAEYREHDSKYFPIYSGKHMGTWDVCSECHTNTGNYGQFTCISCHEHNQSSTNEGHGDVQGYMYNSDACYACHPTGSSEGSFNHNNSPFPLTGAHQTVECSKCHTNGYAGTSTICYDCHATVYNQSVNPNHVTLTIPKECQTCHTTDPGWAPATFPIHDNYYVLAGAHIPIANQCATCHNGDYNNTPTVCFGCHSTQYNQSTNPNHVTAQFPTTCETCHSQTAWNPTTFDHNTVYPLTGAHATIATNCFACHKGNYTNTPNTCVGCHQTNYNQSTNPNHGSIAIPTECATCHTTNPGWAPATFPIHNNYYALIGAHAAIASQCATCHNGNYNNTPNTCYGCHQTDYNQTTNPSHAAAQFPTTCTDCHNQNAWVPANWDHDGQYFPIYSGKHNGQWTLCSDCHKNASNYAEFTCTTSCHPQSEMNNAHQGVSGYSYTSSACYNCHPNGNAPKMFQQQNINNRN